MTPLSLVPEQAKLKGIGYGELVERLIAEALRVTAAARTSAAAHRRGRRPRKSASRGDAEEAWRESCR